MKTYAFVVDNVVAEIIYPAPYEEDSPLGVEPAWTAGEERPLSVRYPASFCDMCLDITDIEPQPQQGWVLTVEGGSWTLAPYVAPPPTAAEILESQSAKLVSLKYLANAQKVALTNRISELSDAVEYEVATPEEEAELPVRVAQRKAWGLYSIDLGRVTSQEGWPPNVIWPQQPAEGMDLTVSAARSTQAMT